VTRKQNTGTQAGLLDCPACGRAHRVGSDRYKLCQARLQPGGGAHPAVRARPVVVAFGELSRTGEGERPAREPMPHPVFSAQALPRDVQAAPQDSHETIPTTRPESKRLVATLRAAAASAVREWRAKGAEPTQHMMFDMDVYRDEVIDLLDIHIETTRDAEQALASRGLGSATAGSSEHAERLCYHAIRTVKGLAIHPSVMARILARADIGSGYDSRDFTKFAIGLRAVAHTNPAVRRVLSKPTEDVDPSDLNAVAALLRNFAATRSGRVRLDEAGRARSEVLREHLAGFGPDAITEVNETIERIHAAAAAHGEYSPLSASDDCGGLLALPSVVAGDLLAHGLSYAQWRDLGWSQYAGDSPLMLLEPALVAMRRDGMPDEMILAIRPDVGSDDTEYPYSVSRFLAGPGAYAVGGQSERGVEAFGSDVITNEAEQIRERFERDTRGRKTDRLPGV